MSGKTVMTTDERFQKVEDGQWWDATGIDMVPEEVVGAYMADNPGIGLMVMGASPEGGQSRQLYALKTTDERYRELSDDTWWDTSGTDVVPYEVVRAHMIEHDVGVTPEPLKGSEDPDIELS